MADGILTVLIYPRIKAREIEILNFTILCSLVIEMTGIGTASEETLAGILPINYV
jgi:hypothetical protein